MKIIPESKIQQEAFMWFNNKYCLLNHDPRLIIYSVPNGINVPCKISDKIKALDLLNKTGQLSGASDLIIQGMYGRTLNPECKTKEGVQSSDQINFQNRITKLQGRYFIFRDLEEFIKNIEKNIDWLMGLE